MDSGRRTVVVYLSVFAGLVLAGLMVFAPLPPWTWLVIAAPAGVIVFLAVKLTERRAPAVPPREVVFSPPPPAFPQELTIGLVPIPSAEKDYDFLFSATVRWSPTSGSPGGSSANLGNLAMDAILERAIRVAEKSPPERAALVQYELNGALGTMQANDAGTVRAMAEAVTVVISESDQRRLTKLAEIRKKKAVWEHERKYEQSRREYLGGDVLKDPGSAVVWWLAKHDEQVDKVVEDLGILAQVTSAANNRELPDRPQPTAASANGDEWVEVFSAFLATGFPDDNRRALFSSSFADLLTAHGKHDLAADLASRFDAPSKPADPPDEPA
ncbi:hypothetical protein [Nonomuraea longicatena]|uniref:Secreted protein n=1 Tax=Nonomuraea longicatena TaxID=83682 RepID=A0ABP3ZWZ4_9ACTN